MMALLYQWVPTCIYPPRWMGFVYYSVERDACLFVVYPFHFIVVIAWWVQDRWAKHAAATSWLEREVKARLRKQRQFWGSEY